MVPVTTHPPAPAGPAAPRGTGLSRLHHPAKRKIPPRLNTAQQRPTNLSFTRKSVSLKKNPDVQLHGGHHYPYLYHFRHLFQQSKTIGCPDLLAPGHQHATSILPFFN